MHPKVFVFEHLIMFMVPSSRPPFFYSCRSSQGPKVLQAAGPAAVAAAIVVGGAVVACGLAGRGLNRIRSHRRPKQSPTLAAPATPVLRVDIPELQDAEAQQLAAPAAGSR